MANPIQQILGQLMQDPAAMQGMMNFMQGQAPTAGMPMPPSAGGGMPGGMPPQGMPPGVGGGSGDLPPMGPPEGEGAPDPEAMAQGQIDNAGYTWDGTDAPTSNDIQRLKEDPSEEAIESFNEQFGDGAAEKYLGGGGENEPETPPETDRAQDDDRY